MPSLCSPHSAFMPPEKGFACDEAALTPSDESQKKRSTQADIPSAVARRLLHYVPDSSHHALRLTCKSWSRAVDRARPLSQPAGNIVPPEILLQIFYMLNPRDFNNARRICSQWMRVSLDHNLLESMLKRAGWWDAWLRDCQMHHPSPTESLVWRMSKRFSTECLLSGRKTNVERPGFLTTGVVDFSKLSPQHPVQSAQATATPEEPSVFGSDVDASSRFNVSMCGNYVLVTSGCMIHVYRLLTKRVGLSESLWSSPDLPDKDIDLVASISCPDRVVSATIDTSAPRFVVAALLRGRVGMVCDVTAETSDHPDKNASRHYYHDVCSLEDPPRSVSICPRRRCVAFGGGTGIELRWVDEASKQDCRKHFPMTQPSEILHFLPNRSDPPEELRLISSLAGPGGKALCQCAMNTETQPTCAQHLEADVHSLASLGPSNRRNLSLVRATHCHHYRAIPINDGLHILFIEPQTGFLCIGSDAPLGGPTNLTRALVCAPPFGRPHAAAANSDKEAAMVVPTVFAAGSDLSWGLRVVAAYQDRLVLYSVPLDVFNVIRKERERQGDTVMGDSDLARDWFLDGERSRKRRGSLVPNQNGDWEFLLSVSYRPTAMMWPLKIYGKEIGRVDNIVELALQSSYGGARVWAFSASGETAIIDVDTFTSTAQRPTDVPCRSLSVDTDGSIEAAEVVGRSEPGSRPRLKRAPTSTDFKGQHSTLSDSVEDHADNGAPGKISPVTAEEALSRRRPSYAACIVGFNIPELGAREGSWVRTEVPN